MKKQPKRNLSVRIDLETYEVLRQIAKQESRTVSSQAYFWIRQSIWEWEHKKDGETNGFSIKSGLFSYLK